MSELFTDVANAFSVNMERFLVETDLIGFLIDYVGFLTQVNSEELRKVLCSLMIFIKYDIENNKDIISLSHQGHFVIVNILKKLSSESNEAVKEFFNELSSLIEENFGKFIHSKGAFIILVIFENEAHGELS